MLDMGNKAMHCKLQHISARSVRCEIMRSFEYLHARGVVLYMAMRCKLCEVSDHNFQCLDLIAHSYWYYCIVVKVGRRLIFPKAIFPPSFLLIEISRIYFVLITGLEGDRQSSG